MTVRALVRRLSTAADTEAFGGAVARACPAGVVIHLHGDLAAGKTTFTRGYLRGLGHAGAVKSPTFTLVESYDLAGRAVHHFDLYRLAGAAELEFIGIEEYLDSGADCLFEWAERGAAVLPPPDLSVRLTVTDDGRAVEVTALTARGDEILSSLA